MTNNYQSACNKYGTAMIIYYKDINNLQNLLSETLEYNVFKMMCNQRDLIHNNNDQPALIYYNNYVWFKNGKIHREIGSAIISDKDQKWFFEDNFIENGQKIYEATEKQQLVEFLIAPNIGERLFAEHRYKILF